MCVVSKSTLFTSCQSTLPTLYLPSSPALTPITSPFTVTPLSSHPPTFSLTYLSHSPSYPFLSSRPPLTSPLPGVAMEACEFWSALSDDNDAHAMLQSHLGTLIPSLISRLQLKEEQILQVSIDSSSHFHGASYRHVRIVCGGLIVECIFLSLCLFESSLCA